MIRVVINPHLHTVSIPKRDIKRSLQPGMGGVTALWRQICGCDCRTTDVIQALIDAAETEGRLYTGRQRSYPMRVGVVGVINGIL